MKGTEEFIEKLKSWREENPDERNFIVVVHEKNAGTVMGCEGNSTALSSGILTAAIKEESLIEETQVLLDTAYKLQYVLDNMKDFCNWLKDQHAEDS